jgi:hypothetical protein
MLCSVAPSDCVLGRCRCMGRVSQRLVKEPILVASMRAALGTTEQIRCAHCLDHWGQMQLRVAIRRQPQQPAPRPAATLPANADSNRRRNTSPSTTHKTRPTIWRIRRHEARWQALPAFLAARTKKERVCYHFRNNKPSLVMVGCAGVEPTTNGLKVRCSTN